MALREETRGYRQGRSRAELRRPQGRPCSNATEEARPLVRTLHVLCHARAGCESIVGGRLLGRILRSRRPPLLPCPPFHLVRKLRRPPLRGPPLRPPKLPCREPNRQPLRCW